MRRNRNTSSVSAFGPTTLRQHPAPDHPGIWSRNGSQKVGTELERALQRRRAEAVVDREQRTGLMGDLGNGGDIDQFGQRVGGRFDEEQPRIRPDRGAIACQIGRRNEARLDPELRKHIGEQLLRRAEKPLDATTWSPAFSSAMTIDRIAAMPDAVATQASPPPSAASRCLHRGDGGIGKARIDIAILAPENRAAACRRSRNETRGQVQRLAMLVELAAVGAGPHRKRIEVAIIHVGNLEEGISVRGARPRRDSGRAVRPPSSCPEELTSLAGDARKIFCGDVTRDVAPVEA